MIMAMESGDREREPKPFRLFRSLAHRQAGDRQDLPDEGRLPSFDRATGWIGPPATTTPSEQPRVTLVNFWTYTCVNWLRTAPYLRAWHEAYADAGLVIIGVHTPEFPFEHDERNVQAAVARLGIRYPVALDNDYGVWDEFANHYWPAVYIADAEGRLRFHHFGEGEYERTEMVLQQLLSDAGARIDMDLAMVEPEGLEVAADWRSLRSPETYLGWARSSGFVGDDDSPTVHSEAYEGTLALNDWTLTGYWTRTADAAILESAGGSIRFAFHARDVNLVMGPALAGSEIRFRVTLDGSAPGPAAGTGIDSNGWGTLRDQDTHQLIRQTGTIGDRVVTIEFAQPGVEAFCFTFG